jgi:hypothetical protein
MGHILSVYFRLKLLALLASSAGVPRIPTTVAGSPVLAEEQPMKVYADQSVGTVFIGKHLFTRPVYV